MVGATSAVVPPQVGVVVVVMVQVHYTHLHNLPKLRRYEVAAELAALRHPVVKDRSFQGTYRTKEITMRRNQ